MASLCTRLPLASSFLLPCLPALLVTCCQHMLSSLIIPGCGQGRLTDWPSLKMKRGGLRYQAACVQHPEGGPSILHATSLRIITCCGHFSGGWMPMQANVSAVNPSRRHRRSIRTVTACQEMGTCVLTAAACASSVPHGQMYSFDAVSICCISLPEQYVQCLHGVLMGCPV